MKITAFANVKFIPINSQEYKNLIKQVAKDFNLNEKDLYKRCVQNYNKTLNEYKQTYVSKGNEKILPLSALYDVIEELKLDLNKVVDFKIDKFIELVDLIRLSHRGLFPLRNPFNGMIAKPSFYITPDMIETKKLPKTTTAYAMADATFVFNSDFLKRAMYVSKLKGDTVKGDTKYESNGGNIPDYYAPVEFVVLHELYHFVFGDHFFTKYRVNKWANMYKDKTKLSLGELKQLANLCINYVGDYIINNKILHLDIPMLPIGLISDNINYDNFDSYDAMFKYVYEKIIKKAEEKKDFMDKLEDFKNQMSDDHSNTEEEEQQQAEEIENNMDKIAEEIDKDIEEVNSAKGEDVEDLKEKERKKAQQLSDEINKSRQGGRGGGGYSDVSNLELDLTYKPILNWRKILKKMFSLKRVEDSSYRKINIRKHIQQHKTVVRTGRGIFYPGKVSKETENLRLFFVIDESGSMSDAIKKINVELKKLLNSYKKEIKELYVLKFSESVRLYRIDIKTKKAFEFKNPKINMDFSSGGTIKNMMSAFKEGQYGATNLDNEVYKYIKKFVGEGFSLLLITDTDSFIDRGNKEIFEKILQLGKKTKRVYVLFGDESDFKIYIKTYGGRNYKFISYVIPNQN